MKREPFIVGGYCGQCGESLDDPLGCDDCYPFKPTLVADTHSLIVDMTGALESAERALAYQAEVMGRGHCRPALDDVRAALARARASARAPRRRVEGTAMSKPPPCRCGVLPFPHRESWQCYDFKASEEDQRREEQVAAQQEQRDLRSWAASSRG